MCEMTIHNFPTYTRYTYISINMQTEKLRAAQHWTCVWWIVSCEFSMCRDKGRRYVCGTYTREKYNFSRHEFSLCKRTMLVLYCWETNSVTGKTGANCGRRRRYKMYRNRLLPKQTLSFSLYVYTNALSPDVCPCKLCSTASSYSILTIRWHD